jgi:hypothetical protein
MKDRAELLRKRIAAYRRALETGGAAAYIRYVLEEIARDQSELDGIEKYADRNGRTPKGNLT